MLLGNSDQPPRFLHQKIAGAAQPEYPPDIGKGYRCRMRMTQFVGCAQGFDAHPERGVYFPETEQHKAEQRRAMHVSVLTEQVGRCAVAFRHIKLKRELDRLAGAM